MGNIMLTDEKLASIIAAVSNSDDYASIYTKDDIQIADEDLTSFHLSQNVIKDVNTSIFFLRELEYIQRQPRDTKQKKLKGMMLFPVSTEAPEWTEYITYRRLTRVGLAKVITDYAHDFPRADVYREEFTIKVKGLGSSYGYSKNEILQARATGQSLNRERAVSCRRAVDELQDSIIWDGDATYGIQGFIDYPGFTAYVVPNGGAGTADFASKTPDEILADLNGIATSVISTTNGVEAPDTMVMPIEQWRDIATRRLSDSDSETVLSFFLKTNGIIRNVDWAVELNAAGAGGTDRFMVYPKSPDYIRTEMPKPYREEPPLQKGMEFEVVAEQRTAGILVYYPLAFAYGDGI